MKKEDFIKMVEEKIDNIQKSIKKKGWLIIQSFFLFNFFIIVVLRAYFIAKRSGYED